MLRPAITEAAAKGKLLSPSGAIWSEGHIRAEVIVGGRTVCHGREHESV